jgi:epoxide hydrolase-like predicted phosphatase
LASIDHPYRAIIWDMGGVLVRNMAPEPRNRLAEAYHISEVELEKVVFGNPVAARASVGEASVEDLWKCVQAALNIPDPDLPGFIDTFWSSDRLDEELLAFILSLRPDLKTALLSNAFPDLRYSLGVRFSRLLSAFDEVIISAEEKMAKPDPRIYRLALDRLGVAPNEAIFVDDVEQNVEAARALGITAIQFRSGPQAREAVLEVLSSAGAE